MPKLIPSLRVVRRTLECEIAYTLSRMAVLERIPGNPVGIAYRHLEVGAVALMARHLPVPGFNSVVGLRAGHEQHIEPLTAWYRGEGVKAQFETVPGYYDPALGRELARLGYYQSGFHTSLVCGPDLVLPSAPGDGDVERVESAAVLEEFLDAYIAGRSIPQGAQFKANVRPWLGEPGWQLYLARCRRAASCRRHPLRPRQGRLLRRRDDRSGLPRPRPADGAARAPHRRRPRRRRRLRVQRRRLPVPEPPQHGARRHARAVRAGVVDGTVGAVSLSPWLLLIYKIRRASF